MLVVEGDYAGTAYAGAVVLGAQSTVEGDLVYSDLTVSPGAKLNTRFRAQRTESTLVAIQSHVVMAANS